MSGFFDYTDNPLNQFESFSINHIVPLLLIIIGVSMIYVLRDKLALSKYEITIRYTFAIIAILFEVSFQAWQMYHGKWNFADSLPLHLCRLTNYLGIIAMLTRNSKLFKVAYFWCLSGVVSILFPDILHGPDRFRYYHHMISHMLFFYMYMYMLFVLKFELNLSTLKKSYLILLVFVLIVIIPINNIFDMNYMYLLYPADTPFSIFDGHGYILYLVGCLSLTTVIMILWYIPLHYYNKRIN